MYWISDWLTAFYELYVLLLKDFCQKESDYDRRGIVKSWMVEEIYIEHKSAWTWNNSKHHLYKCKRIKIKAFFIEHRT